VMSRRLGSEISWPEWRHFGKYLTRGLKIWAIIMTYLLPSMTLFWIFGCGTSGFGPDQVRAFIKWLVECLILPPVGLPAGLWELSRGSSWFAVSALEGIICALLFGTAAFFIPMGFIQVVLGGRMRDALPGGNGWRLVRDEPLGYCIAWLKAMVC